MSLPERVTTAAACAAAALVGAICASPAAAQASPKRSPRGGVAASNSAVASAAGQVGALRFWTPGRMRLAARAGTPPPALRAARRGIRGSAAAEPGPAVRVSSRPPRRTPIATASHKAVEDPSELQTHGRLFFRFRRFLGSCSATVINRPQRNTVLTAGHCLYDPLSGTVSRHVVFVPAYDNGDAPFGTFPARSTHWMGPWARRANTNFDVGVIVVRANQGGRVGDVVGASGWATGISRWRDFDIFGYPAGALRGRHLRQCTSRAYRADRTSYRIPGPPTMRAFCDMARGASGGGWVTADADGSFVNGVTSYRLPSKPNAVFSPYFGRAVLRLVRRAR